MKKLTVLFSLILTLNIAAQYPPGNVGVNVHINDSYGNGVQGSQLVHGQSELLLPVPRQALLKHSQSQKYLRLK